MEYTKVDDAGLRADILRDHARVAEHDAFIQELERDRQRQLSKLSGEENEGLRADALRMVEEKTEGVETARKLADRRALDAGLSDLDIAAIRLNVLDTWVEALEREHIATQTLLELVEGSDANSAAQRDRYSQSIEVIETSHAFGLDRLRTEREHYSDAEAALEPEPEPEPEPTPEDPEPEPE